MKKKHRFIIYIKNYFLGVSSVLPIGSCIIWFYFRTNFQCNKYISSSASILSAWRSQAGEERRVSRTVSVITNLCTTLLAGLRSGFRQSLLPYKPNRTHKNPSLGEGGCAEGADGWDKELQQMPQSLTQIPTYFKPRTSIIGVIAMLLFSACATHTPQYKNSTFSTDVPEKEIDHSFYLIGDAGNSPIGTKNTGTAALYRSPFKSQKEQHRHFSGR